jgi:hypothetical protein
MTSPYDRLKQRRQEIAEEIAALTDKISALKAEDADLEKADVVMARFIDEDRFYPANISRVVAGVAGVGASGEVKTEGKPAGTPTTPNMIVMLLKEAVSQGKPGLEPREMQMLIARRWWPTVKSEDIGPTAWRMWREGRLSKAEGESLYMLPVDAGIEEAAGLPLGKNSAAS